MTRSDPTTASPHVAYDLVSLLDLERLDQDLFRGHNAIDTTHRPSIFGGQVAAQALRAAGLSTADDRLPHSMHGYFLRAGDPSLPVIYQVSRSRDGRSFSSRHVRAVQHGQVIFELLTSLHVVEEPHPELDRVDRPPSPFPEDGVVRGNETLLEVIEVTKTDFEGDELGPIYSDHMWIRAAHPLPDDPLIHICGLVYASDLGSGFGQLNIDGLGRGGTSIDHSMWFHTPVRLDDWILLELWPIASRNATGVYHGSARDRSGRLGATLSQESLLRRKS